MNRIGLALILVMLSISIARASVGNNKKQEMLKRADHLRVISLSGEEFFDEHLLADGCGMVEELFRGMPHHLTDVMSRMDAFDRKVILMKNESLDMLKETHRLSNRCKNGVDHEFVDASKAESHMKKAARMMKKHIGLIEDRPTDYSNSYYYHYDFDN